MRKTLSARILTLAALFVVATLAAPPAWAGCGCDHPPPSWSMVMPPFGSPGRDITIHADGFEFSPGSEYEVEFGSSVVLTTATHEGYVVAAMPEGTSPGPIEIRVTGDGIDETYPSSLFTALPSPRHVEDRSGVFRARDYDVAIGSDGTLYLALDVSDALEPMQYTFALHQLPLHFEAEDVVIYNADGVDLTLFTLEVDDPTQRQWGSYHGWTVESDANLPNRFYRPQSRRAASLNSRSDLFTYWRHEFHSYAAAHAAGGSHETDANGLHPDGSRHIDHGQLVIAIQGVERDASDPSDLSKATPVAPGTRRIDVGWVSLETEEPVELDNFVSLIVASLAPEIENLFERFRR